MVMPILRTDGFPLPNIEVTPSIAIIFFDILVNHFTEYLLHLPNLISNSGNLRSGFSQRRAINAGAKLKPIYIILLQHWNAHYQYLWANLSTGRSNSVWNNSQSCSKTKYACSPKDWETFEPLGAFRLRHLQCRTNYVFHLIATGWNLSPRVGLISWRATITASSFLNHFLAISRTFGVME